jgi:hypothetical protein
MAINNNTFIPSNKALLSCLIIGVATPISAQADTVDDIINSFTAQASVYSDSGGIRIEDKSLQYQRRYKSKKTDWKLEAHDYNFKGETGSDSYQGADIVTTISKEFNDYITTELSVGAVYLKNKRTDEKKNFTKYKGKVTLKPNSKLAINIEHDKDLLFKQAIIEDDHNKLVSGKTSRVSASWRAAERIIAEGSSQYRKLSDGNQSKHHRAALLYGISTDTPWVWAGVEAQSLSYDETKSNYWSPTEYKAYALIANGNFAVNKKLNLNVSGSLNRTKEDKFDWATGGAVSVGADYALTKNTKLKAHATYLESTRDNVKWDGSRVGVSFVVSNF